MNIPGRTLLFVLTAGCALLLCRSLSAQDKKNDGVFTVVLDAGHGDHDPGAVYGGVKEKDVNLAVTLKLGKLITDNCPDVKVIYTRKTDVFLGLDERGTIANKAHADLFISLHADAVDNNTTARGATTFIMGMDKTENNLREAMRENAVMKYEEDYTEKYEGFDPTSAESYIIFNLMQYAYFDRSLQLANIIQKHYESGTAFSSRGSKQGPFYVLWKPAMPSVLTEMGFLSNEADRKYITSEKGQNEIAKAIFEAFKEYKNAVWKSEDITGKPSDIQQAAETAPGASIPSKKESRKASREGVSADGPGYYVQIVASRERISVTDSRFRNLPGMVVEKYVDGWYKYALGGYSSLEKAQNVQAEVRKGTYKDAFVTAFDGNEQIGMNEAKKRIAAANHK